MNIARLKFEFVLPIGLSEQSAQSVYNLCIDTGLNLLADVCSCF